VNAAACPPAPPTARTVTAGLAVAAVAFAYSVATGVAPASVHRSAVPWYCIVALVTPPPRPAGSTPR
jgi:hypothetical protein